MDNNSEESSEMTKPLSNLFPAYRVEQPKSDFPVTGTSEGDSWLCNASFKPQDADASHHLVQEKQEKLSRSRSQSPVVAIEKPDYRSTDSGSDDIDDATPRKRHKTKKKHKHKYKHKKHKYKEKDRPNPSNRKEEDPEAIDPKLMASKIFIDDIPQLQVEKAYRIDRHPDKNNVVYGSIYKMNIPKHHRLGYSSLGLKNGEEQIFGKRQTSSKTRYYSKENRIKLESDKNTIDLSDGVMKCSAPKISESDFLPITQSNSINDTIRNEINPLGIYDAVTEQYIRGVGGTQSSGVQSVVVYKSTLEDTIKAKTEKLNGRLRENPHDIETWIELVKFQEEAQTTTSESSNVENYLSSVEESKYKKHNRMVLEIKLSILQKAIEANPKNVKLKLYELEVCEPLWEPDKMIEEWRNLLFVHINDISVWQNYLIFVKSRFQKFSITQMMKAYSKCFSSLQNLVDGTLKSHECMPGTQEAILDIFVQLCHSLRQSGHTEKSVSLFQAVTELNLFCPMSLSDMTLKQKLEVLEAFWDSGVPRVGEQNSKGWDYWISNQDIEQNSKPYRSKENDEEEEQILIKRTKKLEEAWKEMESSRSTRHWLPWKPDTASGETEEDCEDPERIVLFDDISSCVIPVHSEKEQFRLVHSFLEFLGVPIKKVYRSNFNVFNDIFLCYIDDAERMKMADVLSNCITEKLDDAQKINFVENFIKSISAKFSYGLQNILSVLLIDLNKEILIKSSTLTVKEQKSKWKEIKKSAKAMLKEEKNRNSLLLWESYAMIEVDSGNLEEAYRILDTAASLFGANSLGNTDTMTECSCYKLYRTYAELLFVDFINNKDEAKKLKLLGLLSHIATNDHNPNVNHAMILRARKKYSEKLEVYMDQKSFIEKNEILFSYVGHTLIHWTICYSLFQHLTVGMKAFHIVFQNVMEKLNRSSYVENVFMEILTEAQMKLGMIIVEHSFSPLSMLRVPLEYGLEKYPNNIMLLETLVDSEMGSNIAGRLRKYFQQATRDSSSAVPWIFAVYAELKRSSNLRKFVESQVYHDDKLKVLDVQETGVSHRVRALLEKAVNNRKAQHCTLVWRIYMHFEVEQGNLHRAKSVFYRSLQYCPWSKPLYMDAARLLPDMLQTVLDLIVEKELRMRTPMEELLLLFNSKQIDEVKEHDNNI